MRFHNTEKSQGTRGEKEGVEGVQGQRTAEQSRSLRGSECVIECGVLCHSLRRKKDLNGGGGDSSDFMPGYTHWPEMDL